VSEAASEDVRCSSDILRYLRNCTKIRTRRSREETEKRGGLLSREHRLEEIRPLRGGNFRRGVARVMIFER